MAQSIEKQYFVAQTDMEKARRRGVTTPGKTEGKGVGLVFHRGKLSKAGCRLCPKPLIKNGWGNESF